VVQAFDALAELKDVACVKLAERIEGDDALWARPERPAGSDSLEPTALSREFHSFGVNLRYLGRVRAARCVRCLPSNGTPPGWAGPACCGGLRRLNAGSKF
jgi:hypothetical protein